MNTTKLHEDITSVRFVNPQHPGLPFMEAATVLLEDHERRLRILFGHIIPERCKPHEGPDVLSRTTEWDEGPVPAIPGEGLYDGLSQEIARHALTGEPYERERSEVEVTRLRDQVDVLEARNARLVAASGTWNVERASLCARLERAESGKHPPVPKDDLTAAYMAGAASRRHDVAQGEEEQQGTAEPCHGDLPAVDSGSPPDDAVDADSDPAHASSPAASSLHNQIEVALDRWGDNLSDERSQAEVVYPVLDAWEARHRKLYEAAQAMCEEVPHQVKLLRENDWDGHADGLESAADRLEAALKEDSDATP